jgi:(2R)-ethylmalonyl-CoA mutase
VVGGIVPAHDARLLLDAGVRAIYTPKDYSLRAIMADLLDIVEGSTDVAGGAA